MISANPFPSPNLPTATWASVALDPASSLRSSSPDPRVSVKVIFAPLDSIVVRPAVNLITPVSKVIVSSLDLIVVPLADVSLMSLLEPAAAA